jgi:hypothetical protein
MPRHTAYHRFFVAASLLALTCAIDAHAAPIASLTQDRLDFGRVPVDGNAAAELEIKNSGDEPLVVEKVQSSCPCARPILTRERPVVPPQGSLKIPIQYVPDGRSIGDAGATIAITTNDAETPVLIAELSVFVEVAVVVRPESGITWSMQPRGARLSKDLYLTPGTPGKPIELKSVEVLSPAIGVVGETVEKSRGDVVEKGLRLVFDLKADAPLGPIETAVAARVIVDGEELEITAPVKGTIIGDALIIPPSIISPKTAYTSGDPISEIIVRSSKEGPPPRVVDAIAQGAVHVEVQPPNEAEAEQRIKVFAGEFTAGGPQTGVIYVMTTSDDQPITTIPVYFRAARPFAMSPEQVVVEPGATQYIACVGDAPIPGTELTFDYDTALLRVTPDAGGASIEVSTATLTQSVATTLTARHGGNASVTIPVLVRVP